VKGKAASFDHFTRAPFANLTYVQRNQYKSYSNEAVFNLEGASLLALALVVVDHTITAALLG